MALAFFSGFETGDFGEWSSVVGSPSVEKMVCPTTPTGFTDPDTAWSDEANAYDNNTGTYAYGTCAASSWGGFLQLTVPSGTYSQLRVNLGNSNPAVNQIDIDVYDGIDWTNIYEGVFSLNIWIYYNFAAQTVTQIRVRGYNSAGSPYYLFLFEADIGIVPKTGDYAMRCNTDAATAYATRSLGSIYRFTLYLYIASLPNSDCSIFGNTAFNDIRLTTTGEIDLYDGGVKIADGSTQLNTEQWHRISGSVLDFTHTYVWINGNIEHDGIDAGGYWGATGYPVNLGVATSVITDLYFDDAVMGDSTSSSDLGDIRVLRSSPNAAGEYAEFDTISGYDKCDEVPASDADIVDDSGVSVLHRECYNLQDCATIGMGGSDTINAVNVWMRGYDSGNTAQGIFVRDNNVDYKTLATFGKAYTWKNKLYDTNAPRGSAWTQAIFDAFQSGGYSEGNKDVYMSCVMVMVAFMLIVGGPTETIVAKTFPMEYLESPIKTKELKSKVSGATISHVAKDFPETLLKSGKAKELRSKWS